MGHNVMLMTWTQDCERAWVSGFLLTKGLKATNSAQNNVFSSLSNIDLLGGCERQFEESMLSAWAMFF